MDRHAGCTSVQQAKPVISDDSSLTIIIIKYKNKKNRRFLYRISCLSIEKSKKVSLNNVKADSVWKTRSKVGRVYDTFVLRILMFIVLAFAWNSTRLLSFVIPRKPCAVSARYFTVVLSTRYGTDLKTWTSAAEPWRVWPSLRGRGFKVLDRKGVNRIIYVVVWQT